MKKICLTVLILCGLSVCAPPKKIDANEEIDQIVQDYHKMSRELFIPGNMPFNDYYKSYVGRFYAVLDSNQANIKKIVKLQNILSEMKEEGQKLEAKYKLKNETEKAEKDRKTKSKEEKKLRREQS